jgi:hypothetical protein
MKHQPTMSSRRQQNGRKRAARLKRNTVEQRSSDIENKMLVNRKVTDIAKVAPNVLIQMARDRVIASLGLRQELFQ